MAWSVYGMPGSDGQSIVTRPSLDKIDMRIQRTFFSYTVRTNDNVQLMLMGTIFWRIENVTKMVLGTSDPSGDVWHHCRSSFMQAVSNTSFDSFMGTFNRLAKDAYDRDVADGFYAERGVSLLSMEVTRFEAVDKETKATLRTINAEATNQITLLKKQEGENAVRAAKMRSDIALAEEQTTAELKLEGHKTSLIRTRSGNNLLKKRSEAEGAAQQFAQHAKTFIGALNETGVSIQSGLGLYHSLQQALHHNTDTQNLASGKASLFLTSKDVKLNLKNVNLGSNSSTSWLGERPCDL
jgi:regulator of protease activity HflC (stomatin/prohibitin superfamily)